MIDATQNSPESDNPPDNIIDSSPASPKHPFFERTDWLSLSITTTLVLVVYLFTVVPNVALDFSGIFSTGAMYAGVPHPPGYPLWTLYAWLFTKLIPFSNIAWRVAVSSAVAGAITCGLIALMVSRSGLALIEGIPGLKRPNSRGENALRIICGYVAGMAFGFNGAFWCKAIVADPWPLSMLLFSITLCLLLRWFQEPHRKKYLYTAFFAYGLTLSNSQALAVAAPSFPFLVMVKDRKLGRDMLLPSGVLCFGAARLVYPRIDYEWSFPLFNAGWIIFHLLGPAMILPSIGLIVKTRGILTEWKTLLISGMALGLGLLLYLYPPVASMSNPPVNWAYPRTAEGYLHLLQRGQYETVRPTGDLKLYANQIWMYAASTGRHFGWLYTALALVPFYFLHRMRSQERQWIAGLSAVYLCVSLLLILVLNPYPDRSSQDLHRIFFSASHLILALWAGQGLMLVGVLFAKPAIPIPSTQSYN